MILSLGFDQESFARLDALRQTHFPPERNLIPAHLTLFHALPGASAVAISAHLAACAAATPAPRLRFVKPRFLGRGVALDAESPALLALRRSLAATWAAWLTPQDRQGFRPHVTIQNKVAPEAARGLFDRLAPGFMPWKARGEALLLWHYRGGPWEAAGRFPFNG
ncbi:2'-5' RNA ligase family protein [Teichococcus oryzae]|uniref:2'-5' RNA ligase family protein n=1 Tax=Teichococcus oryzae TaxID=1608942 RepID=UPI001F4F474C|nr:2'-5' RNA ligase family protein [Pseudoroseomonas oryzae]